MFYCFTQLVKTIQIKTSILYFGMYVWVGFIKFERQLQLLQWISMDIYNQITLISSTTNIKTASVF